MSNIDRLQQLHEKLRELTKEIQQVHYDIWDLLQDMKSETLIQDLESARKERLGVAIAKSDEVAA